MLPSKELMRRFPVPKQAISFLQHCDMLVGFIIVIVTDAWLAIGLLLIRGDSEQLGFTGSLHDSPEAGSSSYDSASPTTS